MIGIDDRFQGCFGFLEFQLIKGAFENRILNACAEAFHCFGDFSQTLRMRDIVADKVSSEGTCHVFSGL